MSPGAPDISALAGVPVASLLAIAAVVFAFACYFLSRQLAPVIAERYKVGTQRITERDGRTAGRVLENLNGGIDEVVQRNISRAIGSAEFVQLVKSAAAEQSRISLELFFSSDHFADRLGRILVAAFSRERMAVALKDSLDRLIQHRIETDPVLRHTVETSAETEKRFDQHEIEDREAHVRLGVLEAKVGLR